MTDAERIAEYLKTSTADVDQCLAEPTDRASSGHVRALAAMLSDVRREEREAALGIAAKIVDGIAASQGAFTPEMAASAIRSFIGQMS